MNREGIRTNFRTLQPSQSASLSVELFESLHPPQKGNYILKSAQQVMSENYQRGKTRAAA